MHRKLEVIDDDRERVTELDQARGRERPTFDSERS